MIVHGSNKVVKENGQEEDRRGSVKTREEGKEERKGRRKRERERGRKTRGEGEEERRNNNHTLCISGHYSYAMHLFFWYLVSLCSEDLSE